MSIFSCFSPLVRKKKVDKNLLRIHDNKVNKRTWKVSVEQPVKPGDANEVERTTFSIPVPFSPENPKCNVKLTSNEYPEEVAVYEAEDEHDKTELRKGDCSLSNPDIQASFGILNKDGTLAAKGDTIGYSSSDHEIDDQSGHVSDPGAGKAEFWASPKLKRSCSSVETRNLLKNISLPANPESFEDLHRLVDHGSPASVRSRCSADKVILKKHSSSQILPSSSRRLWWKLFLWSHRNLQNPWTEIKSKLAIGNQQEGGYSSDTLEPSQGMEKLRDSESVFWGQNQWVAFPAESSTLSRVDEWVDEISKVKVFPFDEEAEENRVSFPPSPEGNKSPASRKINNVSLPEEIMHANRVIQTLNSSSTVAHICGIGLKVIPVISRFSSLRSVNLSGNSIACITPGSLPKSLHTLDLSRNKISTIEGLRDLTRLRILDLSYNRISRIGQGLSNCILIKELYLAGNKISYVEGLHRLLKLTILDLSFNKITTSKSLGQLVANYNSLLALTLLGNPIKNNITDDQLRKALYDLLPKLAYLNKQPINPQKGRELAGEPIAKVALGDSGRSARRKPVKRVGKSHGGSFSSSARRNNSPAAQKSKHRPRNQSHHQFPPNTK